MKIKMLCRLSRKQEEEIRTLETMCRETDKTKAEAYLSNDCNIDTSIPCFYLGYEEKKLICFLVLYFPEQGYAEASFIIHPDMRRQGYFTAVFLKAKENLLKNAVTRLSFVHEPENRTAVSVLEALGAKQESSEYLLCYEWKEETEFVPKQDIYLEKAVMEDIKNILKLHLTLFEMKEAEALLLLKGCIMGKRMVLYKLLKGDALAGFCCVAMEDECCTIFSFAVGGDYQGKGFGKQMLHLLMRQLSGVKRILLHVSSTNEEAYHLYRNFGFQIEEQFDYYTLNLLSM